MEGEKGSFLGGGKDEVLLKEYVGKAVPVCMRQYEQNMKKDQKALMK